MQNFQKILVCLALFIGINPAWAQSVESNIVDNINVCYHYGCKRVGKVELVGLEWNQITELFNSIATTPQQERQTIAKAIALMEQLTGKELGTSNDKAENSGTGEPGQMDCIDESLNTTEYIRYFAKKGWIKWHQVEDRVSRHPFFFDMHWTAVIKDRKSSQLYAVDSWFRDNGKEPVIITLEDWKDKKEEP